MVHFSEIESLRTSLQFLAYSEAYLESAGRLCGFLAKYPAESNYPKGTVVLSLAFHSIELFFKAAILEKAPNEKFKGNIGHELDDLGKRYSNLYPGKKYIFEIPFRYEDMNLVDPDPGIVEKLQLLADEQKRNTPLSQLYRYPRNTTGNPWGGIYAFEASSFTRELAKIEQDIKRLKELIFNR